MRPVYFFVALVIGAATAARLQPNLVVTQDDLPGGLKTAKAWLGMLRDVSRRHDTEEDIGLMNRMFTIRFIVPPSESKDFEDEWIKMEDKEEVADMLTLKSSDIDNYLYFSYGEFKRHDDLHDHLTSGHFNDFANWVDDHGITWELELLNDLSTEFEHGGRKGGRRAELSSAALAALPADATDEQVKALYADLTRRKEMVHVLITYKVHPGHAKGFMDAWSDAADSTLDEKGNRVYSLRKVATDNTRFYTYGTWERMNDYMDHLGSKHVGALLDFIDSKDIFWSMRLLRMVE